MDYRLLWLLAPIPLSCTVLVFHAASGEDLVPEQTCQREENKQEEAAAFPAGLHDDTGLSGHGQLHQHPHRPQPHPQHVVRHSVGRLLDGFQRHQDCDRTEECLVCFIAK